MSNRAYRISFDEKVSKFTIEVQGFLGWWWKPSQVEQTWDETDHHGMDYKRKGLAVRYFATYSEARDAVKVMGLDLIYDDFTTAKPWQQPVMQQPRQQYVGHQPLPQGPLPQGM